MDKPTTLLIEEFKRTISQAIGNSGLPVFIIEYILKDFTFEVSRLANSFAQKEISEYYEKSEKPDEE